MPIVLRAPGLTGWERKFVASVIARSRRGPWRPSTRQVRVMQRLVETFQRDLLGDEGVVEVVRIALIAAHGEEWIP